ncbi:MAG: histidine triad nucleotide-binding protein [Bacillota bacterium]
MAECLFCRIIRRELPAEIVYEDDHCLAFRDINPQAPVHILVVPKLHLESMLDLEHHPELAGFLGVSLVNVAREQGLVTNGFRVITNIGDWGGQVIKHLHFHVLGGRQLGNTLG